MKNKTQNNQLDAKQKYRKNQYKKGIERLELQLPSEVKAKFEAMVRAVSDELDLEDQRTLISTARQQLFEELIHGSHHEFTALKASIENLREEIQVLSPSFFKTDLADKTPLPESVQALPDKPRQLKALIAKLHRETQAAKMSSRKYQKQADQYSKLNETIDSQNDKLRKQLKEHGFSIDE